MNVTDSRKKVLTSAVGAAIATVAAPALLFLGVGTAHAIQDVSEAAPSDAISTLMSINCAAPFPTEPPSVCDEALSWWQVPRPTAVVAQGWLAP